MKWGNFRDGIQILDKYVKDEEYAFCAVHNKIYAGPTEPEATKITEEDKTRLEQLGWYFDNETESYYAFT